MGYSYQAISALRPRGEPKAYVFRRPVRLARDQAHLLRVAMRRLLPSAIPELPVVAFSETAGIHPIETVGQVSRGHEFAA